MNVRVEVARTRDWEAVCRLRLRALADSPDSFDATLEDEQNRPERFWRDRLEGEATTFLAFVDDRTEPVGMTVVSTGDEPDEGFIAAVWVEPELRGRGISDRLLDAAVDNAFVAGIRRIVLDVGAHNQPAIEMYQRHGFRQTGRTVTLSPPRENITEHELALDLIDS